MRVILIFATTVNRTCEPRLLSLSMGGGMPLPLVTSHCVIVNIPCPRLHLLHLQA